MSDTVHPETRRPARWAVLTMWALVVIYAVYFSLVSVRLHDAHHTHKADLGQMDQAIWNTSRGRFVQEIKGEEISTRLTDHVEPIFAPVSLVFWLWDDVRALLVLQSLVLGLGAVPVFYIAFHRLDYEPPGEDSLASAASSTQGRSLAALAFALAYLLYPSLQAANLAEFHALPLATPLILLAFLSIERRQWLGFLLATLAVAAVQEGTALLAAMLGLYVAACGLWKAYRARRDPAGTEPGAYRGPILAGLLALAAGLAWFYVATFVIIPANAATAYGLEETPYAARFGALGESFGDVLVTMITRPGLVVQVALEPLRIQYMVGLLAPMAFLPLAGPEILILGLPLFLANLLSAFPFQYSGQWHYSAPLAAYAAVAAIVGSRRLRPLFGQVVSALQAPRLGQLYQTRLLLVAWLLLWSLGSVIAFGYAPLSGRFQYYWPEVTAHHRTLQRFIEQIPPQAPVSTMPSLYPHLSHRERIYQFPALGEAEFVLVDMAAQSGWDRHPAVIREEIQRLLESGQWAVLDGTDGYLLLGNTETLSTPTGNAQLPDAFYDFARASESPQHPLDIGFAPPGEDEPWLKLVGYDVLDDPQWRMTGFRLYWQPLHPLPADLTPRAFVMTPDGQEVDSSDERPLIQTLWYPPEAWQPGATTVTHKLPWFLPRTWAPAVGLYQGDSWADRASRWRVVDAPADLPGYEDHTWIRLDGWQRSGQQLRPHQLPRMQNMDRVFGGDGWMVSLTGASSPPRTAPGDPVPLLLRWRADGPAPRDYTIFVHLIDADGRIVAQGDARPTWFGLQPTPGWTAGQEVLSAHTLALPENLPAGVYDLVVGWYFLDTQERLALLSPDGLPVGDGLALGSVQVDATAGSSPDLACVVSPEACSSQ